MAGRKFNILVVDDETVVRETIRKILEEEGFNVWVAGNGTLAVYLAEHNEIDVVLLDIKLPDIDGVKVLGRIKAIKPEVKAIMMTAYTLEEMKKKAFNEGADAYLSKPFDVKALFKIFQEIEAKNE